MSELKPCKYQEEINELHRMKKQLLGAQGCSVKHEEENTWKAKCLSVAICALNQIGRPAPENKPLTLEQLRQMDGEPVWCNWVNGWTLVYIDGVSELSFVYCDGSKSTLSELRRCNIELLAYAHMPEQEEK